METGTGGVRLLAISTGVAVPLSAVTTPVRASVQTGEPRNLAREGDPIGLTTRLGASPSKPRSHDRGHRSWPSLPGGDQRELSEELSSLAAISHLPGRTDHAVLLEPPFGFEQAPLPGIVISDVLPSEYT